VILQITGRLDGTAVFRPRGREPLAAPPPRT